MYEPYFNLNGFEYEGTKKTFINLLKKPVKDNKVLISYINLTKSQRFKELMGQAYQTFLELGFTPENIEKYDLYDENPPNLLEKDVILMWGGNENHYINQIRKQGLEQQLREFIDRNSVYVGISAGAIIMGPTVDVEHWSRASNDVGLIDKSGFGFVDFITAPHIDSRDSPEKVIEFHKKTGHNMMYLTNKQGILVIDDKYKII